MMSAFTGNEKAATTRLSYLYTASLSHVVAPLTQVERC